MGRDEALDEALRTAVQVSRTDLSVLIQGESGVGKEILPRIIHDHSLRKNKRYIAINCGSIPEGTIDSELFGHEKGAFTSAIGEHEGYFGAADGGTLFLDEVGELPMSTQARLLRVLETGEYIRVGSNETRKTNARIVAATNVDIPKAIREGRFREDLYYRLCTINIKMPALRKRHGDAALLFKKFAIDTAEKYNIPTPIQLSPEAVKVVNSYKWPGNIRQLRNITEQLSILSEERLITPEVLAKYNIVPNSDMDTSVALLNRKYDSTERHDYDNEIKWLAHAVMELRKEVSTLKDIIHSEFTTDTPNVPTTMHHAKETQVAIPISSHALAPIDTTTATTIAESIALDDDIQTAVEIVEEENLNLFEMEKKNIIKALKRNRYKRKGAAEELGISERTLYRKIKDYGIEE